VDTAATIFVGVIAATTSLGLTKTGWFNELMVCEMVGMTDEFIILFSKLLITTCNHTFITPNSKWDSHPFAVFSVT
jgi:hypothetical protein